VLERARASTLGGRRRQIPLGDGGASKNASGGGRKGKGAKEKGDTGKGEEYTQAHLLRTMRTLGGDSRSGKMREK
jgi:hypothetical protein